MKTADRTAGINKETNDRRDRVILHISVLKHEVARAIYVLKKIYISAKEVQDLVTRFTVVQTLPGIPQNIIKDLIDGFRHYSENRRFKNASIRDAKTTSTAPAIENLTRIIENKDAEIRDFKKQAKSRRRAFWLMAKMQMLFKISH